MDKNNYTKKNQELKDDFDKFLFDTLPYKPYCTNSLKEGLAVRPKSLAVRHKYIQINPPNTVRHLIYDIDRGEPSVHLWEDENLAEPNLVIVNPASSNCHYIYSLKAPVTTSSLSRIEPLRYLHAISTAYKVALKADFGYSGLITKNPFHQDWIVHKHHLHLFTLDDLSKGVESFLKQKPFEPKVSESTALGRNCTVFDRARYWAYASVRSFRETRNYDAWNQAVFDHCLLVNADFPEVLQENEIRHIAKSISKWTWNHDPVAENSFLQRQSFRGRRSGEKRRDITNEKILVAENLAKDVSCVEISIELKKSYRTVRRWVKPRLSGLELKRKAIHLYNEDRLPIEKISERLNKSMRTIRLWVAPSTSIEELKNQAEALYYKKKLPYLEIAFRLKKPEKTIRRWLEEGELLSKRDFLRKQAQSLFKDAKLSIDQISNKLEVPKRTIQRWVAKD